MANYLKHITLMVIFIVGYSKSWVFNFESTSVPTDPTEGPLPCPNPEEISPCVCTVEPNLDMEMDCSYVTSDEELKSCFDRPLPFPNFHKLYIEDNLNISGLIEGCFGGATFEEITIRRSALSRIDPNALIGSASTLRELKIYQTQLSSFPFEEITHYKALTTLDLNTNEINEFDNITSLTLSTLILDSNPIIYIPLSTFDNLPGMNTFTCRSCLLDEILTATFSSETTLEYVSLDRNNLTFLPKDTFEIHGDHASLFLIDNSISNVSVNAIRGVTSVMNLNGNELAELPEEVWGQVMNSTGNFSVAGNPLICGCDIAWIILNDEYMEKLGGEETCSDGQALADLDPEIYRELCT